jgi:subtilisin family serine protease
MPTDVRTRSSRQPGTQEKRVIQIELKTALQPLGTRAKSPSPFRFTTADGRHLPGLHKISLEHEMHSAHPAIHLRYPGKMRRRKNGESARLSRFVHLHFPAHANVDEILRRLRSLPEVEYAAEYRGFSAPSGGNPGIAVSVFPTDPLLGTRDQPDTDPVTQLDRQWYIFRCKVDVAWTQVSGEGVVIADVDSGFFLDHEDLTNQVERNHLYNAWDGTENVSAGATDHGTGVLGLAGATSNTVGIAGVAFNAKLWAFQYNTGTGQPIPGNTLASAIDCAAQQDSGGRRVVINVEAQTLPPFLGNCEQDPVVAAAIQNVITKGCVVCVTSGNGGRDAGVADDGTAIPPSGSILVGATAFDPVNNPRAIAPGMSSNYGVRIVVRAPGDAAHDVTCRDLSASDYTNRFGGTSGAAAKVAGTIALMLEANPALTHDDVKTILTTTGSQLNNDQPMGVFLNADAAVTASIASRTA